MLYWLIIEYIDSQGIVYYNSSESWSYKLAVGRENIQNTVVLGYYSPTEWVFFPEVTALYNKIIINKTVFEETVERGENSPSGYEGVKASLIKELHSKGIIHPRVYSTTDAQHEKIGLIITHFLKYNAPEIRRMLIYAFDAFIAHESATLERLIDPEDPYWKDTVKQIPRLKRAREELSKGAPLDRYRTILRRYFEDSLLVPRDYDKGYNPVFEWEGYGRFEEFLLSFRAKKEVREKGIRKGTSLQVLRSISEVRVPFRPIRSPKEMGQVLLKWDAFDPVRQYATEMNSRIWEEIDGFREDEDDRRVEFVKDFNEMLSIRTANLNRHIQEVDLEVEKEQAKFFSAIARRLIATLISIVPGTAGFAQVLDDVYASLIEDRVKKQYPALRVVFDYERLLNSFAASRKPIPAFSSVSGEYRPVRYWDEEGE